MPALRPFILDVKLPVPMPSLVLVGRAIVGLGEVLQQIPRTVTEAPPSLLIVPPLIAVVFCTLLIAVVDSVGSFRFNVVKMISLPYAVPDEFVE